MNFFETAKAAIANPGKWFRNLQGNREIYISYNSDCDFVGTGGREFILTKADVEGEWEEIIDAV